MDKFQFSNFKAYKTEAAVPIKRLNIIMGCNSSGKSSIFHFLQLLKQSTSPQNHNSLVFTPVNTKQKDLISFNNIIFSHNAELTLDFSFLGSLKKRDSENSKDVYEFKIDYSIAGVGRSTYIKSYKLWRKAPKDDFSLLLEIQGKPSKSPGIIATEYQFVNVNDAAIEKFDSSDSLLSFIQNFLKLKKYKTLSSYLMTTRVVFDGIVPQHIITKAPSPRGAKAEKKEIDHLLPLTMVIPFWETSTNMVNKYLDKCNFIGPIREQIRPFYSNRDVPPDDYIGYSGENLGYYLQDNATIKSVNEALKLLEIPYTLEAQESAAIDGLAVFLKTTGEESISIRPDSVGMGISQLMPILIECSINKRATTLIEQPELHLHPRQHVLLAEFLIKSLVNNEKQSIWVETHSEYLLQGVLQHAKKHAFPYDNINIICVNAIDGEARIDCVTPSSDYSYSFPFDMKLFPLLDFFVES